MSEPLDPQVASYFEQLVVEQSPEPYYIEVWRDDLSVAEYVQMGVHLMLVLKEERPLYLVVPHGAHPPSGLVRLARAIEYFTLGDAADESAAVVRLLAHIERDSRRKAVN